MPRDEMDAPPLGLLDDPLAYILAAHQRQRALCHRLRDLALAPTMQRGEAERMTTWLTADLPLHQADEDQDLYPALRRRALPADGLATTLARLEAEHRQGSALAQDIAAALGAHPAAAEVPLDAAARTAMQAYALSELRHLAIENAVVMALARIRLKRPDLKSISRSMKARRGVAVP